MTKQTSTEQVSKSSLTTLEEMLANTCFCKLKETCPDKNSPDCMRHKNIYNDFMQQKHPQNKA